MKKVDFGINEDRKLNSSFSSISPYNGEYIDLISCNGLDFLVTRIVDSCGGLNGNIDVREVAQDYYSDGSYVNYANIEKNTLCQKFEQLLNANRIKQELKEGKSPLRILKDAGFPVCVSTLRSIEPQSERFSSIVTSVKKEKFQSLKDSKKNNYGRSMYDMAEEIRKLQELLEQTRQMDSHRHM